VAKNGRNNNILKYIYKKRLLIFFIDKSKNIVDNKIMGDTMKKGNIFIILQYLFLFIMIVSCIKKEENNIGIKDETIIIENNNSKIDDDRNIDELYKELINLLYANDYNKRPIKNNICVIHNEKLHKEKIEIRYGIADPEIPGLEDNKLEKMIEFYKLRKKYFPNSRYSFFGGCIESSDDGFEDYICNKCNKEKDKYKKILGL